MKRFLGVLIACFTFAGQAVAGHYAAVGQGNCSYCHKVNLVTQHGGFDAGVCQKCHNSAAAAVFATISSGKAGLPYACSNCHGASSHIQKHPDYMTNYGTYKGVAPNGTTAAMAQVASFTVVNPAQMQYQLCYKCHSSYTLGQLTNGVSGIVGPSGTNLTDQAMEYNVANKSAHPIQASLNGQTGSYAPKALLASQMTATWNKVGTQVMLCSDCHVPGSTGKFMLISGTTWPTRPDGKLWGLNDIGSSTSNWQSALLCAKCHPIKGSGWYNNVHGEGDHSGVACVACHATVPHGLNRSRLIGYASDPAPYTYTDATGTKAQKLNGFRKASSPNSYSERNCYSTASQCGDHSSPISNPD